MKYSDQPLSNFDIIHFFKKQPKFAGVHARDTLPKKMKLNTGIILNLDDAKAVGTHWVALYREKKRFVYFDSYGSPPPQEVVKLVKKTHTVYNNYQCQQLGSIYCGMYTVMVLDMLFHGSKFLDIVFLFGDDKTDNDRIANDYYTAKKK